MSSFPPGDGHPVAPLGYTIGVSEPCVLTLKRESRSTISTEASKFIVPEPSEAVIDGSPKSKNNPSTTPSLSLSAPRGSPFGIVTVPDDRIAALSPPTTKANFFTIDEATL